MTSEDCIWYEEDYERVDLFLNHKWAVDIINDCGIEDVAVPFTGRVYPQNYTPTQFIIPGLPYWENVL